MADRVSIEDALRSFLLASPTITDLIGTRFFLQYFPDSYFAFEYFATSFLVSRFFPQQASQNALLPYVVYNRISNRTIRSLQGRAGLSNPRIQIDCYGKTYKSAKALRDAIVNLIDPDESKDARRLWGIVPIQSSIVEDSDDSEQNPAHGDEIGFHCLSMDVIVWFNENTPA